MSQIYVRANNKIHGPFDKVEVKQMAMSGTLLPESEISVDQVKWHMAGSVKGLFPAPNIDTMFVATGSVTPPPLPSQPPSMSATTVGKIVGHAVKAATTATSQADATTNTDESLIKTLVGKNYDYYKRKWEATSKWSINWSAFFFSIFWMAYRKMYLYACIATGVIALDVWVEDIFHVSDQFTRMTSGALAAAIGVYANVLYKHHIDKEVKRLKTLSGIQQELRAFKAGGTSAIAAVASCAICAALIIVVGVFIPDDASCSDEGVLRTAADLATELAAKAGNGIDDVRFTDPATVAADECKATMHYRAGAHNVEQQPRVIRWKIDNSDLTHYVVRMGQDQFSSL